MLEGALWCETGTGEVPMPGIITSGMQYAKRFLHPDIVAPYDYIFIWDEDLGLDDFEAEKCIELMKKHGFGMELTYVGSAKDETYISTNAEDAIHAFANVDQVSTQVTKLEGSMWWKETGTVMCHNKLQKSNLAECGYVAGIFNNPHGATIGDALENELLSVLLLICLGKHDCVERIPSVVKETLGTPTEVEPLDETQLEDLGLNTCNHDIPLSSREVPSLDKMKPQPQPLPTCPPLDISLGDKRGLEPPIKPHSPDSFRIKEVDHFTNNTPSSPHMASFHPKDTYCHYHPCIGDPKKHYGFKPSLLGLSGYLGVNFLKLGMIENDWELESKEVSFLGRELNSSVRPKEVDNVRIKEIHRLYLMRRSLKILRKFHWMILGGRSNQLSHVSSPLLSKPGEY
ncbi:ribonuclease H-like domain-containing protein [Tanacetum coccineum]